jgi:hypothetical protein
MVTVARDCSSPTGKHNILPAAAMHTPVPRWVLAVSKRFPGRVWNLGGVLMRGFFGPDYAPIAAISGWMPMMFMTRVRL